VVEREILVITVSNLNHHQETALSQVKAHKAAQPKKKWPSELPRQKQKMTLIPAKIYSGAILQHYHC